MITEKDYIEEVERVKEYFKENEIESVVFDMDSTLVRTTEYYKEAVIGGGLLFLKMTNFSGGSYSEAEKIYQYAIDIHNEIGKPLLISNITQRAINLYIANNPNIVINDSPSFPLKEMINDYFKDFYIQSPEIYEDTIRILKLVYDTGVPFFIYSHAQEDWTRIKVRYIEEKFYEQYGFKLNIPFFSTPIEEYKDVEGWIQAENSLGFNIRNSLVIGDSYKSDILPAQKAGCRNLIHITSVSNNRNNEIKTVSSIGKIFDNI